jgi:hypothetical protein
MGLTSDDGTTFDYRKSAIKEGDRVRAFLHGEAFECVVQNMTREPLNDEPTSPVRIELARCDDGSLISRWSDSIEKITDDPRITLGFLSDQLRDRIRAEGGRWDGERAHALCREAGGECSFLTAQMVLRKTAERNPDLLTEVAGERWTYTAPERPDVTEES